MIVLPCLVLSSHESHLEAWNEEEFLANVERGPNYYVAWRTVPDHELSDLEDEVPDHEHNGCRQGLLRLENFWKTKRWQSRVITSILSTTLVDSFKAWEVYHPPSITDDRIVESRLQDFTIKLIEELCKDVVNMDENVEQCELIPIGSKTVDKGRSIGRIYAEQQRCVECVKESRKLKDGRAPKTKWRCKIHPEAFLCPSTKGRCFSNHCLAYGSL